MRQGQTFTLRTARAGELRTLMDIDEAAIELYARAGLRIELPADHPFVLGEAARWADSIENGLAHVAVEGDDVPVGFVSVCLVDGKPYVDQLAVRPGSMRRGIGSALLGHAVAWSGSRPLWLTTYAHLPWNGPYYERHGFVPVPESACGPELLAILEEQRAALPAPGERIAMARFPATATA